MRHWSRTLTLLFMTAALAACQSNFGGGPRYDPNSIEGQWFDPNGILSTFSDGQFETRTTDTNTLLATGKYTYTGPRVVQIDLRSLVRNTSSKVNCSLASPSRLNCTSSTGSQFTLTRRTA